MQQEAPRQLLHLARPEDVEIHAPRRSLARRIVRHALSMALFPLPAPETPLHAGPGLHLRWRMGWMKGWAMRPLWRAQELLGGTKVRVGRRFSLQGKITFAGPGTVVIGDDVIVDSHATPFTHAPEAVIQIGDRAFVNGTRFGCARRIEVGEDALLADARIMDTDFHPLSRLRSVTREVPVATAPVTIGRNAWVGAGSMVLKGVTIGDDAVVGSGSVVARDVPEGMIAAGNPAKPIAPVPD